MVRGDDFAMDDRIRVFIGTDERGGRGEAVLDYGIRKYSTSPVEITLMRPGGGEIWEIGKWNMGRKHFRPYSSEGWATNFSCFRWSVPEAAGFAGRAIYLDADQTVHADISELFGTTLNGLPCAERPGVILFDCSHSYWKSMAWPSISTMQQSGWGLGQYKSLLKRRIGTFDPAWDVLDGSGMDPSEAKLNHYTAMQWQPYHPFPDRFRYPERHPISSLDEIWWKEYANCLGITDSGRLESTIEMCIDEEHSRGLNSFGRRADFAWCFTDFGVLKQQTDKLNPDGWRGIS